MTDTFHHVDPKVNPTHYTSLDPQPYSVISSWKLDFTLGNIIKYVARFSITGNLTDLRKAKQYLDWAVYDRENHEGV